MWIVTSEWGDCCVFNNGCLSEGVRESGCNVASARWTAPVDALALACVPFTRPAGKEMGWTIGRRKEGGMPKAGTWSMLSNINSRRTYLLLVLYAVIHRQTEEGGRW